MPLEDNLGHVSRFFQHTDVGLQHECWEWVGNKPDGRYGHFSLSGRIVKAHRFIYEICCGPIPQGLVIRHKCDNPSCVNPSHLTVGTHKDNSMDRQKRGRGADRRGEKHPLARLTAADVYEIRRRYRLGETQEALASSFPVSTKQIGKIVRRENWRHI